MISFDFFACSEYAAPLCGERFIPVL